MLSFKSVSLRTSHLLGRAAFLILATGLVCGRPAVAQDKEYIPYVPDWSQPTLAVPQSDPDHPDPLGPWGAWCVPTATADCMGYYRDQFTQVPVADGVQFPNGGTWLQDSDFQDDCAEGTAAGSPPTGGPREDLGYFFNTNDYGVNYAGMSHYRGTILVDVDDGITAYLIDHGFKTAYVRTYGSQLMPFDEFRRFDSTCQLKSTHSDDAGFAEIKREIDAGRPLLGHWESGCYSGASGTDADLYGHLRLTHENGSHEDHGETGIGYWCPSPPLPPNGVDEDTGEPWNPDGGEEGTGGGENGEALGLGTGLGHTMTIVGYFDAAHTDNPHTVNSVVVLDNADNDSIYVNTRIPIVLQWTGSKWKGLTSFAPPRLIFVDHSAATLADDPEIGKNWDTAYKQLSDALQDPQIGAPDAGSGGILPVEIWVAKGTYTPNQPGDPNVSFELRSGVAIYGGFNGSESRRNERDPRTHKTILSGDVLDDDGEPGGGTSDNSLTVVVADAVDATAVLDGFTITAGHGGPVGGLEISGESDATVVQCTFLSNSGMDAGGIVIRGASRATVNRCKFLQNEGAPAVMLLDDDGSSEATITNSVFLLNDQGGVEVFSSCEATVINCSFVENGNWAIRSDGFATVTNSILWNNDVEIEAQPGTATVSYSDVEGCGGSTGWNLSMVTDGGGNIDADPRFMGTCRPRVFADSPCIDAGDSEALPSGLVDVAGNPRLDARRVQPSGNAELPLPYSGPVVDMGAYEYKLDPTLLCAVAMTQGFSDVTALDTGMSCSDDGETTSSNSFARSYDLGEMPQVADQELTVFAVQVGIELNSGDDLPAVITVYEDIDGGQPVAPGIDLVPLGSVELVIPADTQLATLSATFEEPVIVPVNSVMVVEFSHPPHNGVVLPGCNSEGESGPTYILAEECGVPTYVRLTDLDFEGVHWVQAVFGNVEEVVAPCPPDLNIDGNVSAADLALLLGSWGPCAGCIADLDDDGSVTAADLAQLLGSWGPCE